MLKNFWYACEFSTAVTNQPNRDVKSEICPHRNSQAQVVVLKDQCPHRGAVLFGLKVTVSVVPIMDGNSSRMH